MSYGKSYRKSSNRPKLEVVKKNRDATICRTEKGKTVVLYTPTGKCKKFGREMKAGRTEKGEKLTDLQYGLRMGYRMALGEQSKIYKKKH